MSFAFEIRGKSMTENKVHRPSVREWTYF